MALFRPRTEKVFQSSLKVFPGGVNSPVRSFQYVGGGTPVIPSRGKGAKIVDIDGNEYIDYVLSYGPLILGHAHPEVVSQIIEVVQKGTTFAMPTLWENELASKIQEDFPEIEKMRFTSSGTEAVMSAIRLARGFTKRPLVVKFEGCYHGHADFLLIRAGSGVLTSSLPGSQGVPPSLLEDTRVLPWGDLSLFEEFMKKEGERVACVVMEVVPGNMGLIPPEQAFVKGVEEITHRFSSLLIADEVLTGYRIHRGGAYHLYGIKPDLVTLGKVVGGGFPLALYGGRREIMDCLTPLGGVYQAGTLSGNPVACSAGVATLTFLKEKNPYPHLSRFTSTLVGEMEKLAQEAGVPFSGVAIGSMFGFFFRETYPKSFSEVHQHDKELFRRFFFKALEEGIHFPPSPFETSFVSVAHTEEILEETVTALRKVFLSLRKDR